MVQKRKSEIYFLTMDHYSSRALTPWRSPRSASCPPRENLKTLERSFSDPAFAGEEIVDAGLMDLVNIPSLLAAVSEFNGLRDREVEFGVGAEKTLTLFSWGLLLLDRLGLNSWMCFNEAMLNVWLKCCC